MTNIVALRDPRLRRCAVPGCGNTFMAVRANAKYCSDRCRLRAQRKRKSNGVRVWPLPLPDETIEGIADALQHEGLPAANDENIIAGIARHLTWWAEHWRELRRR
jgi:hypothetical protein